MTQTQEQIEKLRTLQESYDALTDTLITDPIAKESTLSQGVADIKSAVENIDLTPVESKVDAGVAEIKDKLDNLDLSSIENKIDNIDMSAIAKQGENADATNTAIYEAVKQLPDLSLLYAARAEKNDDGENTYSIVLPVTAKVVQETNGVATIQL